MLKHSIVIFACGLLLAACSQEGGSMTAEELNALANQQPAAPAQNQPAPPSSLPSTTPISSTPQLAGTWRGTFRVNGDSRSYSMVMTISDSGTVSGNIDTGRSNPLSSASPNLTVQTNGQVSGAIRINSTITQINGTITRNNDQQQFVASHSSSVGSGRFELSNRITPKRNG